MVREQKVILTSVVAFSVFFGVALWYLDVLCDCKDDEEAKKLEERLDLLGRQKHEVEQQLKEMEIRKIEAEDILQHVQSAEDELSKELHQAKTEVTACEEKMKNHDLSTKLQGELETEGKWNHKKQNETDQLLQYLQRVHNDLKTKFQEEQQKATTLEGKLELLDRQKDEVEKQLKDLEGRKSETDRTLQQVQKERDDLNTKLQQERQKAYPQCHERKQNNKEDISAGIGMIILMIIILCTCCVGFVIGHSTR